MIAPLVTWFRRMIPLVCASALLTVSSTAAQQQGYQEEGIIGYLFSAHKKGTVPLKLFWHSGRQDLISVSTKAGIKSAQTAGYKYVRHQGYVIR